MTTTGSTLSSLQTAWEKWNIRGVLILSLFLQAFLTLLAPLRKRSANTCIIFCVWSAYFLADWVAAFAVGNISVGRKNDKSAPDDNGALIAFWASFLLVHLGGPGTITAFALEDNALWYRKLLNVIFQASTVIYILYQTWPENKLWIPTLLILFAGQTNYVERIRALYLASSRFLKMSVLEELDYSSLEEAMLPAIKEGDLDEIDVVKYGYGFFKTFKGLLVDVKFTPHGDLHRSREFFQKRTAVDALKVISIELNFIYEVLYTKMLVVGSKIGYLFRILTLSMIVTSLFLFIRLEKHQYHIIDRAVSYVLLYGAIGLEIIALLNLLISDWTVANTKKTSILNNFLAKYASFNTHTSHRGPIVKSKESLRTQILWKSRHTNCISFITGSIYRSSSKPNQIEHMVNYDVFNTKIWFRRWSESICAYNLFSMCLRLHPPKILKDEQKSHWHTVLVRIANKCRRACEAFALFAAQKLGFYQALHEALDSMKHVSRNPFLTKLWDFIYDELRAKSESAKDIEMAKQLYEAKGEWVLRKGKQLSDLQEIMEYVRGDYDRIVLLWHIATELCYNTDENPDTQNYDREFSKILSDYMLYLLMKQPAMVSNVAGISQIRFRNTCADVKKCLDRRGAEEGYTLRYACQKILDMDTSVKRQDVKREGSKSVLLDGCRLAKELREREDKWKITSWVWVEVLSYAAGHCKADAHAQVLGTGGELLTFVWLLMAHLGIGDWTGDQQLVNEMVGTFI